MLGERELSTRPPLAASRCTVDQPPMSSSRRLSLAQAGLSSRSSWVTARLSLASGEPASTTHSQDTEAG